MQAVASASPHAQEAKLDAFIAAAAAAAAPPCICGQNHLKLVWNSFGSRLEVYKLPHGEQIFDSHSLVHDLGISGQIDDCIYDLYDLYDLAHVAGWEP